MSKPQHFKATITFRGYDTEQTRESGLPPLPDRIRECLETHPTASFRVDTVDVEEVTPAHKCRLCGQADCSCTGYTG